MRSRVAASRLAIVAVTMLVGGCSALGGGGQPDKATLGSLLGIPDDASVLSSDVRQRIEELTAQCMIAEGWEYIPVTYPEQYPVNPPDEDELARIKRVGLGVANALLNEDGNALGYPDPWVGWVNPNDAYVASLTEDEQAAYNETLSGSMDDTASETIFDPATGSEMTVVRPADGCAGKAGNEAYKGVRTQTEAQAEEIRRYWTGIQDRVKADPRTVKLNERWVACMKKSGYDYASPDTFATNAYAEFSVKVRAVAGDDAMTHPTDGWSPDQVDDYIATHTPEEVDALFNARPELTAEQRSGLEQILNEEISVAVADFECRATTKMEAASVWADVEDTYVREHEAELTALAAAMADGE